MGYQFSQEEFQGVLQNLRRRYRLFAPVLKKGEGRFTDTDVVRYDEIASLEELELDKKSDYSFKEILTPLSQTLFFFTENSVKEADTDEREVIVFLRSCDRNAVLRLDQIYLKNGNEPDPFYAKIRSRLKFALIGCRHAFENCFCVDMGTNQAQDYSFSLDLLTDEKGKRQFLCDLKDSSLQYAFDGIGMEAGTEAEAKPSFAEETGVHVEIPEEIPLSIYKDPLWDEYTARCINCGRCNFVCPTCTCFTMQDIYYSDNGKVGERRRVAASCMVDRYTDVAGGGSYRRTNGERMRFKVLHKISDFRKRFGYQMCVGCGRCDDVCPEYISFSTCVNKVAKAVRKEEKA